MSETALITRAREARGFSQSDVALFVGVTQATVSRWESRIVAPPGSARRLLARLLALSEDSIRADYPPRGKERQRAQKG